MARYIRKDFTTVSVSTLTALMDWTDLSGYPDIVPVLINDDATNNVNLIVETSDDPGGTKKPDIFQRTTAIPALKQGAEDITNHRKYWRISAQTDSPGFPTVSVRWALMCDSRV